MADASPTAANAPAPAHDLDATSNTNHHDTEPSAGTGEKLHIDTSNIPLGARNPPGDSSDSDLTPIKSDDEFEENPFAETSLSQATPNALNRTTNTETKEDERPAKRRRVSTPPPDSQQRKPNPVSPPWKKFEAEGPTTIIDNGKRRSGRVNIGPPGPPLPPPPQAAKSRLTRGALQDHKATPPAKAKQANTPRANGHVNGVLRYSSGSRAAASKTPLSANKGVPKKPITNGSRSVPKATSRRRLSPSPPSQTTSRRTSARTRRSSRNRRDSLEAPLYDDEDSSNARPTKIRLRVKSAFIPIVHPAQVNVLPGQTVARPKVGEDFADFLRKAPAIDVQEGGWQDLGDDGPSYTDEQAVRDAKLLARVEEEAKPGGLLDEDTCAAFVPEAVEEPPRQWAHMDHMLKATINFRRLMLIEHHRHRTTARKLADACRDEWLRRQPKTAEQIEAEARGAWMARYRTVVKVVSGTWENVRAEINRRRLDEWEAAEQKRVKAALNEAVNMSELKLQARRAHFDSEVVSEEDDEAEDDVTDDEVEEEEFEDEDDTVAAGLGSDLQSDDGLDPREALDRDEDNMTSSDDEDDAKSDLSDAELTQEQLRAKYANVPDLPRDEMGAHDDLVDDETRAEAVDEDDTSDESVDMDDDMGSSDDNLESDVDDGSEDEEDEEEPSGLLGLLFGKSELKQLKTDTDGEHSDPSAIDVEMGNASPPDNSEVGEQTNATEPFGEVLDDTSLALPPSHDDATVEQKNIQPTSQQQSEVETPQLHSMEVDPPLNPYQANVPNAMATVPGPLSAQTVGNGIADAVKHGQLESDVDMTMIEASEEPSIIPSVEALPAPVVTNVSPGTDAVTNVGSRDPSQSPRTSETKVTDADTVSSVVKSGLSRSTSPAGRTPKTELPFLLRGTLREYQHYGLDWLAGLYRNKTNGILADEMGLGKTIQTIALLAHLACHHEVWGPHLVIVPTSVMLNWEMEFKKWCPGFKVLSYYGSIEERKRKRQGWKTDDMWNVCITSYQIVLQDQQVFKRRRWHYMILDEAHNIKNFKSKRWQTLLTFNTQARLLLTGTPLQNNLTELWSLLFFLMPSENGVGGFADLAEFQDWFHKPESQILESGREQMDDEARAIIAKLHKVLRPYLLRRLKADVEKQMPAKYEHVEFCRLSRRQRELYDGFLARTDTRDALASGNYISVINCLMQLRKVCNHPDLFVERPIMTSFRQRGSVAGDYEFTNRLVKDKLLAEKPMSLVSLSFLNLLPTTYEDLSGAVCDRGSQLSSHRSLMDLREAQKTRAQSAYSNLDPSAVESNIVYLESAARWGRFEELQHCVYINALRRQQRPIYGKSLRDFLTIGTDKRPHKSRPKVPAKIMSWFEEESPILRSMVLDIDQRAASMKKTISRFACITPAVITRDADQFVLGSKGVHVFDEENLRLAAPVRYAPFMPKESPIDPWHEARMRLSIQFPDKRLLQYDCGKLQALDRLLRKLQSGGHRALIFTQMTKVLDILEQFLNIHGHKYLRLDGATKVEQRQILTDRFNNDNRILAFILSTRSGGLGINLTGADTVIFYDQDWNPAMDKQCQDRCHRIGQTRDVHIYRLISEHTIEANILRKASQKQMLDDVVIQEGGFTTDYFNKMTVQDVMKDVVDNAVEDVVGDAMDRVLGGAESGGERAVGRVLEQAEDREDVAAAHEAEKEIQEDEADFDDKAPTTSASGNSSTRQGTPTTRDVSTAPGIGRSNLGLYEQSADAVEVELNAFGEQMRNIDDFMLGTMGRMLEGTPLELPKDKKKGKTKKGKDTRKR
ncbi:SWR1-DEAH-box protein- putative RNA helicase [Apiospora kogelbergensis]|uniref:DNA helicase n=1 Tax=Apiospora kogelbergensis TaxID=1337665 RepID=A0AAW0QT55_9PEZI